MTIKEEKIILEAVGNNIKKTRAQKNIAQNKLAALLGWQKARMSRIEAGLTNIPLFSLFNIATALGVETYTLLDDLPKFSSFSHSAALNKPLFEKFTQYSNRIVEMNKKLKAVMDAARAEPNLEKRADLYTEGKTMLKEMAKINLEISRITRVMYS